MQVHLIRGLKCWVFDFARLNKSLYPTLVSKVGTTVEVGRFNLLELVYNSWWSCICITIRIYDAYEEDLWKSIGVTQVLSPLHKLFLQRRIFLHVTSSSRIRAWACFIREIYGTQVWKGAYWDVGICFGPVFFRLIVYSKMSWLDIGGNIAVLLNDIEYGYDNFLHELGVQLLIEILFCCHLRLHQLAGYRSLLSRASRWSALIH